MTKKKIFWHYDPIQAFKDVVESGTEVIALPNDFSKRICFAIEELQKQLESAQNNEIWGFYEDLYPIYTSRANCHPDLSQPMTVKEANWMVDRLKEMKYLENQEPAKEESK